MHYVSTRGVSSPADFAEVLLGGPAPDGGLYLPEEWPLFKPLDLKDMANLSYAEVAFKVIRPFLGGAFSDEEFREDVNAAYASFRHPAVVPLVQIGPNRYLLELFHGPTLAFKDVAMQLLGRLFARALHKQNRRATVIVATSGDTGSAAIHALKGQPNVDVVVLHPKGRVSEVQRRQMTTVLDSNIHNVAVEGTFDETQAIVKALFADTAFAESVSLTAVNSINFARIIAQCVYYFTASAALGGGYGRAATFVVPTGNFGDVFAGEAAWRMRLPIERLVVATNENDIMARALNNGVYVAGAAHATLSPSMDIQVASNFERALFESSGRDAEWTKSEMENFASTKRLDIPTQIQDSLRIRYVAESVSDDETIAAMKRVHDETGLVIDPHTGVAAAAAWRVEKNSRGPVVILATAHPAKFPDAVRRATGSDPVLPVHLAKLMEGEERCTILPNDIDAVREFVKRRGAKA